MRFMLCAGVVNGVLFATGVSFLLSPTLPLIVGVVLMIASAFGFGLLLGGDND